MAEKDIAEKTLEDFNDVFADIVNGYLFKGKALLKEEDLIDAQPASMYKTDGKMHEQERDVSKFWVEQQDERINVRIAFLGIENQTSYDKDMPLRVIGYDGAAYRAQLGMPNRYPVVTLVLYFGIDRWVNRSLYDVMEISDRVRPYVNDYRINLFEVAFTPEEEIDNFHSDFKVVVDYFVRSRGNPDYRPKDPVKFKHVDELLKMMSALTHDSRYERLLDGEGGKPEDMCEVLDRVEERGKLLGRQEGREEGRQEGIDETRLNSIRSVMKSFAVSAQKAMEVLEIPASEWDRYYSKL